MERKGRKQYRVRPERGGASGVVRDCERERLRIAGSTRTSCCCRQDREDGGRTEADLRRFWGLAPPPWNGSQALRGGGPMRRRLSVASKSIASRGSWTVRGRRSWFAGLLGTAGGPCALDAAALGDKLVELEIVDSIHKATVRKALKKTRFEAVAQAMLVHSIRRPAAEFVCAMEDVLEVYHREFSKTPCGVHGRVRWKQQTKETRTTRPQSGPVSPRLVASGKARLPCGCETHATVFVSSW